MLNKLDIYGLYGLYNYKLDFTEGEDHRLKIITGPNGYGKTTILQLIYALFCKDTDLFYQIPFSRVAFYYDDFIIQVVQTRTAVQPDKESDLPGDEMISVYFEMVDLNQEAKKPRNQGIRGTGTFIHSLYTNIHNIFPQESLSKCSLS